MERREFFRLTALTSFGAALLPGCASSGSSSPRTTSPSVFSPDSPSSSMVSGRKTLLGIDVLEVDGFSSLQGQRVGLVTHKAGVNGRGQRTVDVLARASGVKLAKLFGPEHGIDGKAAAEVSIKNARDARTGLPVYSLYGATRRPTPEMLEGLDVVVIDFQDIGSRSYTYISCMRYVMEACFSLDRPIRVVVLDRPNPLGGEKVDGPFIDRGAKSYVGAYEMPYVHGLTIGEIARWAVATPGVLEISEAQRKRAKLEVIALRNWNRSWLWNQTGLNWVPTSPRIPNPQAALGYAMVGLGCIIGDFSHTYRDQMHFRFIRYSKRKTDDLVSALGSSVPGLKLEPKIMPDGTQGVYTSVTDWSRFRPTSISLQMMKQCCIWDSTNPFAQASHLERDLFVKHVGSANFLNELRTQGARIDLPRWMNRWSGDAEAFRARTTPFRLYT